MTSQTTIRFGESSTATMDSLNQMTQVAIHQPGKSTERFAAKWPKMMLPKKKWKLLEYL